MLIAGSNGVFRSDIYKIFPYAMKFTYKDFDITNRAQVIECIREIKPDAIINTETYTDVESYEENQELIFKVKGYRFGGVTAACPKVAIIILNWNGWKDTIECLESLYQITYLNYDVILVDNGSEDESIENIKKYCEGKIKVESDFFDYDPSNKPIEIISYTKEETENGSWEEKKVDYLPSNRKIRLIKNNYNYGFAEGNNVGIRYALKVLNPKYFLLLNNDTVVDRKFLEKLVAIGETEENIGIIGPNAYYYNFNGRNDIIWSAGGTISMWTGKRITRKYRMIDKINENHLSHVDFISGAALLIKKEVVSKIGLLDSDYFTYTEDVDWCYRTKRFGYEIVHLPSSKVWHKVSMSTKGEQSPTSLYLIVRNSIIFMKKNARIYQWPSYIMFSSVYFIKRMSVVDSIRRKSMINGLLWHLKSAFK